MAKIEAGPNDAIYENLPEHSERGSGSLHYTAHVSYSPC